VANAPMPPGCIEAPSAWRGPDFFMDFEPGNIQLLHNHQILHDRTGYVDWPDPSRKRHLLRLWLCPPAGRPLPDCFAPRYGRVEIGRRGGILVPGATLTVPLEPSSLLFTNVCSASYAPPHPVPLPRGRGDRNGSLPPPRERVGVRVAHVFTNNPD
jgi:Taurine catabolism dioxygenase TauD, TfdA family